MTDAISRVIETYQLHDSIRGAFGFELFKAMAENERIWLILPDLGWGVFDKHIEHFPERVKSIGASEQAALGIAVGLALEGKIPIVYSITSFLLCRPFEWIRNYLHQENIPVLLVGSGLDDDYKHDGPTHASFDAKDVLGLFPRIGSYFPANKSEVQPLLQHIVHAGRPAFLGLRR